MMAILSKLQWFPLKYEFSDWTFGEMNHPQIMGIMGPSKCDPKKKWFFAAEGRIMQMGQTLGCFNPSHALPLSQIFEISQ